MILKCYIYQAFDSDKEAKQVQNIKDQNTERRVQESIGKREEKHHKLYSIIQI